jgi:hypothetical protein
MARYGSLNHTRSLGGAVRHPSSSRSEVNVSSCTQRLFISSTRVSFTSDSSLVFDLSFPWVPDDITNTISVVVVAISIYYAYKIVRLSREFEFAALRGGKAPYYIIIGLIFLEIDRLFDLFTNTLAVIFSYQITVTFNDPPATLAGFFIALGLREMYVAYRKEPLPKRRVQPHEIWETEKEEKDVPVSVPNEVQRRNAQDGRDRLWCVSRWYCCGGLIHELKGRRHETGLHRR